MSGGPATGRVHADVDADVPMSLREEWKRLFVLAYPITLAQVGLMSLHLVDTAIVGKTSVDDLAGVALGRSLAFLTVAFGMGVPLSLEALATQAFGAGERETAWAALLGALRASLLVWVPISLVAVLLGAVLVPLGVEAPVAKRALLFLVANVPGALGFLVFLTAKTYLQAQGRTTPALVAALVANVFNFLACMLLVRGDDALAAVGLPAMGAPKLGALGAGLASSLASLLLAGLTLRAAWLLKPTRKVTPMPVLRVARLGLPIGFQLLAEVGVFSVVAIVAGRLGAQVIGAHQVAISLASLTFMIAIGISGAAAVRVGAAVGQGRSPRRVGYTATALGVSVMALGALTFLFFPHVLGAPFTNDAEVHRIAVRLLRIAAMFQLFDATQGVLAGALRGAGDVRLPFLLMLLGYWGLAFPLALALAFGLGWGAEGLWWGLSAGLCFVAVALFLRFHRLTSRPIARV